MTGDDLRAAVAAGVLRSEVGHRELLRSIVDVAWLQGSSLRVTGNSFATPHMTGICALVLGGHPELTPFQLKSVLYLTATNMIGSR